MCTDLFTVKIIGGGMMGLSVGWQLVRAQIPTIIFDRGDHQASRVAAGMLAPYTEAMLLNARLFEMGKKSLSLFPKFLEELKEDTETSIQLDRTGTLLVSIDRDDAEWLARIYSIKQKGGYEIENLSGDAARDLEPMLSAKVNNALCIKHDAQIDQNILLETLKKAFLQRGGKMIKKNIDQIPQEGTWIIAAGAWSSKFNLPIRPLKGEIITLKMTSKIHHMIRSRRVYIAPKSNQTVRVGATSEERGFNLEPTAEAMRTLLQESWEIVPALDQMPFLSIDVGLRPLTIDHLPLLGKGDREGLFYATGHGRSGCLLAPYTAYKLKEEICAYYSMEKSRRSKKTPV